MIDGIPEERLRQMLRQREEVMRMLGVLIERAGGEVRITADELMHDRAMEREEIGFTGVILLRAKRA